VRCYFPADKEMEAQGSCGWSRRQLTRERRGQKERERENLKQTPCMEPDVGLYLMTLMS